MEFREGPHGKFMGCVNYPQCTSVQRIEDGYVKGEQSTKELRNLRKKAHDAFDDIWKSGSMERGEAYLWLAKKMDLPEEDAHIANFNIKQCEEVIEHVKYYDGKDGDLIW